MRARRWGAAVLAAALVLGACSSDSELSPQAAGPEELLAGAVPVRRGVTQPAPADLGPGWEVAEGSVLVGGVLRHLYSDQDWGRGNAEDEGWMAVLLVTEPGRPVFERYVAQAQAAGFAVHGSCSDTELGLRCSAAASEGEEDHLRSARIDLVQERASGDRPPTSSIVIDLHVVGQPPYGDPAGGDDPLATPTAAGTVPTDGWPPIPDEGEPFWSSRPSEPFTVAEGTVMLAHTIPHLDAGTLTIFEIPTGLDVEQVLQRYAAQSETSAEVQHWERGGRTVDRVAWTDGGGYRLRAYHSPGEQTWAVLEAWPSD